MIENLTPSESLPSPRKPIPGWEGFYEASYCGQIISVAHHRFWRSPRGCGFSKKIKPARIVPGTKRNGYLFTFLRKHGKQAQVLIHRIIGLTWIPNPLGLPQINHKDGNRENNHADNLEWVTPSENAIHAYRVLNARRNGGKRALSFEQAQEIRKRHSLGATLSALALEFKSNRDSISKIVNNRSYLTHVKSNR